MSVHDMVAARQAAEADLRTDAKVTRDPIPDIEIAWERMDGEDKDTGKQIGGMIECSAFKVRDCSCPLSHACRASSRVHACPHCMRAAE